MPTLVPAGPATAQAIDDTLRTPPIVEPGARKIIDQMLTDYEGYLEQYHRFARASERDEVAFLKADSLLHHAENVYAGLVDAMEINTFTPKERRRLDTAKARFDRLATQYHGQTRPKRKVEPRS